jgi:hypothetical protein
VHLNAKHKLRRFYLGHVFPGQYSFKVYNEEQVRPFFYEAQQRASVDSSELNTLLSYIPERKKAPVGRAAFISATGRYFRMHGPQSVRRRSVNSVSII